MPEQLKLYLPYYLQDDLIPLMREQMPTLKHEIIHLNSIPRLPRPRAAYFDNLLRQLWEHGHGEITPDDIFAIAHDQQRDLERYYDREASKPVNPQRLIDGNIKPPRTYTSPAVEQALRYVAARERIQTYINLPPEQACQRTSMHHHPWLLAPIEISEAEHLLRSPYINADFSDTMDTEIELHREHIREKRAREATGG